MTTARSTPTTSSSRRRRDHDHDKVHPANSEFEKNFNPKFLRRCVNEVLRSNGTTTEPCIGGGEHEDAIDGRKRTNIIKGAKTFHNCLCDLHRQSNRCKFDLVMVQQNKTALEGCFGNEGNRNPFSHTAHGLHIACGLRKESKIICRQTVSSMNPNKTRFQSILDCISDSLTNITCPVGLTTTTTITTTTTTVAPARLVIFVMALVISLFLGVLFTCLGIYCCRKKRRLNRLTEKIPTEEANNYVPDEEQVQRGPVMPNMAFELPDVQKSCVPNTEYSRLQLGRLNGDHTDYNLGTEFHIPAASHGYYETVYYSDDDNEDYQTPGAARPVPKPRTQDYEQNRTSSASDDHHGVQTSIL